MVRVSGSCLARYIVTSLLHVTSNLVTLNLVSATFVTNAMEVAMRLLETGKSHLASSSPKPFQNRAKNKTSFERKQATAKRTACPQVDKNHMNKRKG